MRANAVTLIPMLMVIGMGREDVATGIIAGVVTAGVDVVVSGMIAGVVTAGVDVVVSGEAGEDSPARQRGERCSKDIRRNSRQNSRQLTRF